MVIQKQLENNMYELYCIAYSRKVLRTNSQLKRKNRIENYSQLKSAVHE